MTPESTYRDRFSRTSERTALPGKKGRRFPFHVFTFATEFVKRYIIESKLDRFAQFYANAVNCLNYDSVNASMTLRNDAKEKNHEFRGHERRSFLSYKDSSKHSFLDDERE